MLIVDNCVGSFGNQLQNGIPIMPFEGNKDDVELTHLARYIREAVSRPNPVAFNSSVFGLQDLRYCKDTQQYIHDLASVHGVLPSS